MIAKIPERNIVLKIDDLEITKVYIIESLLIKDSKTGHELHSIISKWDQVKTKPLINIQNKNDLFEALEIIYDESTDDDGILIDFETHGDIIGMKLADNSIVEWQLIKEYLLKINIKTKMGLVINCSMCWGGFMAFNTSINTNADYYALWGPNQEIDYDQLIDLNLFIMNSLISGIPIRETIDIINKNLGSNIIQYLNNHSLFIAAFKEHIDNCFDPNKLVQKLVSLDFELKKIADDSNLSYREVATNYINQIANTSNAEQSFNNIRDEFLMTKNHPDLFCRFHTDFDDIFNGQEYLSRYQDFLEKNTDNSIDLSSI